jgi:hypothetical protein
MTIFKSKWHTQCFEFHFAVESLDRYDNLSLELRAGTGSNLFGRVVCQSSGNVSDKTHVSARASLSCKYTEKEFEDPPAAAAGTKISIIMGLRRRECAHPPIIRRQRRLWSLSFWGRKYTTSRPGPLMDVFFLLSSFLQHNTLLAVYTTTFQTTNNAANIYRLILWLGERDHQYT